MYVSPRTKRSVLIIGQNLANPSIVYPLALLLLNWENRQENTTSQEEIFELLNN